MAVVTRRIGAAPPEVWTVLADGWLYPSWVVGTSRVRAVDAGWPQPGAAIHHSVGMWPLLLSDRTEVLEERPGSLLRLRTRGWPLGEAVVQLALRPVDADATDVTLTETPTAGPGALVHNPVSEWVLTRRNIETLWRLAAIAEGRGGGSAQRRHD